MLRIPACLYLPALLQPITPVHTHGELTYSGVPSMVHVRSSTTCCAVGFCVRASVWYLHFGAIRRDIRLLTTCARAGESEALASLQIVQAHSSLAFVLACVLARFLICKAHAPDPTPTTTCCRASNARFVPDITAADEEVEEGEEAQTLAKPKSVILQFPKRSSMRFSGFRSRYTMLWECR